MPRKYCCGSKVVDARAQHYYCSVLPLSSVSAYSDIVLIKNIRGKSEATLLAATLPQLCGFLLHGTP